MYLIVNLMVMLLSLLNSGVLVLRFFLILRLRFFVLKIVS